MSQPKNTSNILSLLGPSSSKSCWLRLRPHRRLSARPPLQPECIPSGPWSLIWILLGSSRPFTRQILRCLSLFLSPPTLHLPFQQHKSMRLKAGQITLCLKWRERGGGGSGGGRVGCRMEGCGGCSADWPVILKPLKDIQILPLT